MGPRSEECKRKIGEASRRNWTNPEYRQKVSGNIKKAMVSKWTEEGYRQMMLEKQTRTRKLPACFQPGHGRPWGDEKENLRRRKIAAWFKAHKVGFIAKRRHGQQHPGWKGDEVGYTALHAWLVRAFGAATACENKNCVYPRITKYGQVIKKPVRFEWANIDGTYERDKNHWRMLCSHCHRILDKAKDKSFIEL